MTLRTDIEQLQEKDREILYRIHQLRIVTMEQFRMISGYGKSYSYEKVREYARLDVIIRKEIKGTQYELKEKRQRIYLNVT